MFLGLLIIGTYERIINRFIKSKTLDFQGDFNHC